MSRSNGEFRREKIFRSALPKNKFPVLRPPTSRAGRENCETPQQETPRRGKSSSKRFRREFVSKAFSRPALKLKADARNAAAFCLRLHRLESVYAYSLNDPA